MMAANDSTIDFELILMTFLFIQIIMDSVEMLINRDTLLVAILLTSHCITGGVYMQMADIHRLLPNMYEIGILVLLFT